MKVIDIPHHDSSPNYLSDELCGSVAIFTNLQIFSYSEKTTRSCVNEPKSNSHFLTVVTQMKSSFSSSSTSRRTNHIVQGMYPASCMSPYNLSSSAWISIICGWSWSSTTNVCTSLFTSIQMRPGLFLHTFFHFLDFKDLFTKLLSQYQASIVTTSSIRTAWKWGNSPLAAKASMDPSRPPSWRLLGQLHPLL
jgi:hypothetical protein